jgi:hypothetical protein
MTQTRHSIECLTLTSFLFNRRDISLDPFSGSGTAVTAARCTNRYCYGIEFDAHDVDTIMRCLRAFKGQCAILDSSGRSSDDIEEENYGCHD